MTAQQFKKARGEDLNRVATALESVFNGIDTSQIRIAAGAISTNSPTLKNGKTDPNFWGYEIEDLKIPVHSTRHLKPKEVNNQNLELLLSMKMIANYNEWEKLVDPIIELNFKIVIRGLSEKGTHYFCFHIDKHDSSSATDEPHPTYHLQFASDPYKEATFDYGSTLALDTPRIIHHPVELILGVGFLASNFCPTAFEKMMDDGYFLSVYKTYQKSILRPYFHTISSHWDFDISKLNWAKQNLCPTILE